MSAGERFSTGTASYSLAESGQLDGGVELLPAREEDRARIAVQLDPLLFAVAADVEIRGESHDGAALELDDGDAEVGEG